MRRLSSFRKAMRRFQIFSLDLINKIDGKDFSSELNTQQSEKRALKEDCIFYLPTIIFKKRKRRPCLKISRLLKHLQKCTKKDLMIRTFYRHMEEKSFKKIIYQLIIMEKIEAPLCVYKSRCEY